MSGPRSLPRRAFLAGAGAASVLPGAVVAQISKKRVAIVSASRPFDELKADGHPWFQAVHSELRRLGWVDGQNLTVDLWSGSGRVDRDHFVRQIFASRPDVVVVGGYVPIQRQLAADKSAIPVVVLGPDPIRSGLVRSIARPGGRFTGVSTDPGAEIWGKRLQLISESVPRARSIAYFGPSHYWPIAAPILHYAAERLGVTLTPWLYEPTADDAAARSTFRRMTDNKPNALLVGGGAENTARSDLIGQWAVEARLPGIGLVRDYAEAGLFLSYGPDFVVMYGRTAFYVDRILKGTNPAELPIQQPERFEFVINKKTADALGLEIPLGLWVQATDIIE